jgi:hypothetical protein
MSWSGLTAGACLFQATVAHQHGGSHGDIGSRYSMVSLSMIHAVQNAYPMFRQPIESRPFSQ